ncbi:MAG: NAD(+)/NADH kinase [Desulfatibacillum sp.]|nr:NAD(+)/NADH kinase [Desulfatibacillum sp.]
MKKIGIFAKVHEEPLKMAGHLQEWLANHKIEFVRQDSSPPVLDVTQTTPGLAPSDLSCVIVLGGDGTFLSAARWIGNQKIPILGVKFGAVGFLSETKKEDLYPVLESVLNTDFKTQARTRLLVTVHEGDREVTTQTVLNDVVINNGTLARLAHVSTYVDEEYLTTFRADGLIVATPTGSTAYSLAAGGPILEPQVAAILLTPICPFTLTNRPLIVTDTSTIRMALDKTATDVTLTFDGQAGLKLNEHHTITIQKSPAPTLMIKVPGQSYFDVLKTKLRWSGGKI